ncbi:MAG: DUF2357 domain-containing protein, partial [Bacteroidetes bacterium]|nr:DUF2357 domain-containing protein [Bacteroidota bacterium]
MPHLLFSHPQIGTLRLTVSDVRLPESIRDKLATLKEVRFIHEGLNLTEKSVDDDLTKKPFFYEWQKVELFFDPSSENGFQPPYYLRLNKQKTEIISQPGHSDHKLYGQIRLADVVGFTDFEIIDQNGRRVFFLQTEVFPQKLDYKEDFSAMIEEISEMVYQLAYDYLSKTYGLVKPTRTERQTPLEWISILTQLFDSLEKSLALILRNPQTKLQTESKIKSVERIRSVDSSLNNWILRHPAYYSTNLEKGISLHSNISLTHLPEKKKTFTYDRFENQFVVWAVGQVIQSADVLIRGLNKQYKKEGIEDQIELLKYFQSRLKQAINHPVFQQVKNWDQRMHYSSILTRAPGYRDFYHQFLLLQKGLSISQDDIFQLDYKRISTLYEYWCFLKMVKILRDEGQYDCEASDLIKVEQNRLVVNLRKGKESRIRM